MALPLRYVPHYTIDDYQLWEGDWELWSGTAVAMSPSPKKVHQRLSKRLVTMLDEALREANCSDCEVFQEVDWRVNSDTVFRPDLSITCSDTNSDYLGKTPELVIEILSDSNSILDLTGSCRIQVPFSSIFD